MLNTILPSRINNAYYHEIVKFLSNKIIMQVTRLHETVSTTYIIILVNYFETRPDHSRSLLLIMNFRMDTQINIYTHIFSSQIVHKITFKLFINLDINYII